MELLSGTTGIVLPEIREGVRPNYAYFPVVFEDGFRASRDDVFNALATRGIGARKYFYPLVSNYACYEGVFDPANTPVAQHVADRVLTLPMYAELELEDVGRICDIVLNTTKAAR